MIRKLMTLAIISLCLGLLLLNLSIKASAGSLKTSDFIDQLEMNGDVRIRYEYKEKDVDNEDATDRWRQRVRIGLKWNNPEENWKIAAGLATGGADATSTNDTYSEEMLFETGDIRLDYAYAEHKKDDLKFIAGQMKNPFESSWLFWDSDVRPVGLTAGYFSGPMFVTVGGYDVKYVDKDVAYMYAIQAGAKNDMINAALSYYTYNRVEQMLALDNLDDSYGYDIIDLYLYSDIKTESIKIKPYAQIFYNVGAKGDDGQSVLGGDLNPEDENLGWIVGCESKIDKFKITVDYAQIGADSCLQGLKDSDFGDALNSTDVQGFKVGLGYDITKNFNVAATAYLYEAMERNLDQAAKTYHLDLNYKM